MQSLLMQDHTYSGSVMTAVYEEFCPIATLEHELVTITPCHAREGSAARAIASTWLLH